jgi:hypothetical protein
MKILSVAAVVLGCATPGFSDVILSTGFATYTVVEQNGFNLGATGTAQIVTSGSADAGFAGGWVPNSSSSAWVAFDPNNAFDNGLGNYTTTFTLTAGDLSTASISGFWTLDDSGSLFLNGNDLGDLPDGAWTSLHPFSVSAGSSDFVVGANTLSIDITDSDVFLEGVDLAASLTTAVPEPSPLIAMVTGLGVLLVVVRRPRHL